MARFLSWEHLKQEHIETLRSASCKDGPSPRQVLQECLSLGKQQQHQNSSDAEASSKVQEQQRLDITLDLFSYALRRGQDLQFDDERLSVLVGLVKEVHDASITQRLTIENSFQFFKQSLLNHSVHRPPFSCGVFSQSEMQAILDWMLDTYYRHYKHYQYVFTNRVTLSINTFHPSSLFEAPPAVLAPLSEALTEQQHQQELDEQQRQLEEQERIEAEAAAAAAAEAAARKVQEEYEASLPDDVKAKVAAALEREAAYLKQKMQQQFEVQQAGLLARLSQLEAIVSAARAGSQHAVATLQHTGPS